MTIKILFGIGLASLLVFLFFPSVVRFLKTAVLIVRVSPYERTIPETPTILVLGDSTGYGTGATRGKDTIAGRIAADFSQYSIKNNSKNGRTINELMPVAQSITGSYSLILLQIGGNDILQKRDVSTVEIELRSIIEILTPHTEHVVMMSTGNVGGAPVFSKTEAEAYERITRQFRQMFLKVAAGTTMTYVDLFLEPEVDIISQQPDIYLALDRLHPSSAGYKLWYDMLYPVLKDKLNTPE